MTDLDRYGQPIREPEEAAPLPPIVRPAPPSFNDWHEAEKRDAIGLPERGGWHGYR